MTKVYLLDVRELELDINKYRPFLCQNRLNKINNYVEESDKLLSLGSELLLIYAIRQEKQNVLLPLHYDYSSTGCPNLLDYPDIHISISHSKDYACVAISDDAVGVDVQHCRAGNPNVAKRYFEQNEYRKIINCDDWRVAFYQYWVLKESYLKATGYGFIYGMNSFSIDIDDFEATYQKLGYHFKILPIAANYQLGICLKSDNFDVSVIKLNANSFNFA